MQTESKKPEKEDIKNNNEVLFTERLVVVFGGIFIVYALYSGLN